MKNFLNRRIRKVSNFKTNAWKADESARKYHESTVLADASFSIAREDIYVHYVQKFIDKGSTILDVGAGSGIISRRLHDLGYKVVACDISEGMISEIQRLMEGRSFETRTGSGYDLPAENNEFDAVISRMFLPHFSDWENILREKSRVTKSGGNIIFDFCSSEHYEKYSFRDLESVKFPYSSNVKDVGRYYATSTTRKMKEVARKLSLDHIHTFPYGILTANCGLWLGFDESRRKSFVEKIDSLLKNPEVREFYYLLEKHLVSNLPPESSYNNITVLKKIGY